MQSPYHRLEEVLDAARDILEEIPDATPSNTPRTQSRLLKISNVLHALLHDARQKRITPEDDENLSDNQGSQQPSREASRTQSSPSVEQPVSSIDSCNPSISYAHLFSGPWFAQA
jgi:hypothetical protein